MFNKKYKLYKIIEQKDYNITLYDLKNLLPESINNRDLRLLQNGIRSDISYLLYKDDIMLIKFDYISVIITKGNAYCINFEDNYSIQFIEYIKN